MLKPVKSVMTTYGNGTSQRTSLTLPLMDITSKFIYIPAHISIYILATTWDNIAMANHT